MHDGLEDRCKGCDPDARAYQHSVLGVEDLTGGCTERPINKHMKGFVDLSNVNIFVVFRLAARAVKVISAVFLRYSVEDEVVGRARVDLFLNGLCTDFGLVNVKYSYSYVS